ncbi:MAG TPA: hypothetical protein VJ233_16785 [Hyphomicrobiaceae bacterium]|nr:hypothetical protein [Hyphomicrobiaceae bacterium]
MAYDDELRIIRELQAKAQRDMPLEVELPDRGLYIFQRFPRVESVSMPDNRTIELHLATDEDQRVVVPIAADQLERLKTLVDRLASTKSRPR